MKIKLRNVVALLNAIHTLKDTYEPELRYAIKQNKEYIDECLNDEVDISFIEVREEQLPDRITQVVYEALSPMVKR